jgi:anti-sigma28 factor (negative regulator of flagellin synthesis)
MPAKNTPTASVRSVDPVLARKWLRDHNVRNRKLRPNRVEDLKQAILRGEWRMDGSPIRFSLSKKLLDGQHRLKAIEESGRTVQCLVIWGLDENAQEVMDRNLARTYADKLQIDEEPNATTLASAVNLMWRFEHAYFGRESFGKRASFPQLDDVLNRHPELRRSVTAAGSYTQKIKMPRAYIAVARTVFLGLDEADADRFLSDLMTGENLTAVDPAYRLREALNQNALSASKRYSSDHLLALTFKAWNTYRKGEPCKNLSFRAGGASPEAYPMPI